MDENEEFAYYELDLDIGDWGGGVAVTAGKRPFNVCRYLEDPTRVWSAPSFEPRENDGDRTVVKQNVAKI